MIAKVAVMVLATAGMSRAGDVPVESAVLGTSAITLHVQPFLTKEELVTLRLVMTNDQALSLFVPDKAGFAALAVSPEDGFIRDGAPVISAIALAGLPDAATAAAKAVEACNAARAGTADCVTVLEIAPAP